MIYKFLIIILFLVSTAHGAEKPWFPGCPASIRNSQECAQYLEKKIMKQYPELTSREGKALIIKIANGTPIKLVDIDINAEQTNFYNIIDVLSEIGYALVHVQLWEGRTYYLINLGTGQIEDIKGLPVISPSKGYLVSTNFGGVSGYTGPFIKVYKLTKPNLSLEWSHKPKWDPSDPKWISDTEISLIKNVFSEELFWKNKGKGEPYIKKKIRIVYTNGQWRLIDKPNESN